jgi:hypothetical protein
VKIERNVGRLDAVLRLGLSLALFGVSLAYNNSAAISLLAALAALAIAGTAVSRKCPAYTVLKVSTAPRHQAVRPALKR